MAAPEPEPEPMSKESISIVKHVTSAAAVLLSACVGVEACSTEDTVLYGDPARVVTSGGPASTGTGSACEPDPECAVSFEADIFTPILETTASCAASACHETSISDFEYVPADAASAYAALSAYQLEGEGAYVVPCDPESSKLLCNLRVTDGEENPFGECGSLMPRAANDMVDDEPLTLEQLNTIAEWITCGAPEN